MVCVLVLAGARCGASVRVDLRSPLDARDLRGLPGDVAKAERDQRAAEEEAVERASRQCSVQVRIARPKALACVRALPQPSDIDEKCGDNSACYVLRTAQAAADSMVADSSCQPENLVQSGSCLTDAPGGARFEGSIRVSASEPRHFQHDLCRWVEFALRGQYEGLDPINSGLEFGILRYESDSGLPAGNFLFLLER